MTNTVTFVDVEKPLRDWLRNQSITGVDARVFVGVPETATYPCVSMSLVDGGIDASEAPIANALVSFSAWASDRASAQAAAWSLVSVIQSLRSVLMSTVRCYTAQVVTGPVYRPDPDGYPRYVIDATFAMKAV